MAEIFPSLNGATYQLPLTARQVLAANMQDASTVEGAALNNTIVAVGGSNFGRRRKYDVRDYLGSDDIGAAVNRAIVAANTDSHGYGKPGQVVLPPGTWAQTTQITWVQSDGTVANGVDLIGSGWGKTILVPQGTIACVNNTVSSNFLPLSNVTIADFEIDGSDQTGTGSAYLTATKGLFIQRHHRVRIEHMYVHDTIATGIGTDFFDASVITDCVADGCGRGNDGTHPGGAGIGIGTGVWVTESLLLSNNVTRKNGRDGLFFEAQVPMWPMGTHVVNHVSEGNKGHGIADAGMRGITVMGGTLRKNLGAGYALDAGTLSPAAPGIQGMVSGLDITENTVAGILIDNSVRQPATSQTGYEQDSSQTTFTINEMGYTFRDSMVRNNIGQGVLVKSGPGLTGLVFSDVDVVGNGAAGIQLQGSGAIDNLTIQGTRIRKNGTNTALTNAQRSGINVLVNLSNLHITGTRSTDARATGKTQTFGIAVGDGVLMSDAFLDGNDWRNNATSPASILGSFTGDFINGLNAGLPANPGVPVLTPLFADTFQRAANSSSLGSTDGGSSAATPWAVAGSGVTWGIGSSPTRAKPTSGVLSAAYIDTATSGGTHVATLTSPTVAGNGGIAFRITDEADLLEFCFHQSGAGSNQYAIQKRSAGSTTVLASIPLATATPAAGDVLKVHDDPATNIITAFVNGVQVAQVTDASFAGNTKAGLRGAFTSDAGSGWTNWKYYATPTA